MEKYKKIELEQEIIDLNNRTADMFKTYNKRTSGAYIWTGQDFGNVIELVFDLLEIVDKQNSMINNIYNILKEHEHGLG